MKILEPLSLAKAIITNGLSQQTEQFQKIMQQFLRQLFVGDSQQHVLLRKQISFKQVQKRQRPVWIYLLLTSQAAAYFPLGADAAARDAAALEQINSDRYSANLSENTFIEREDNLFAGKFKSFRDDYDLTLLVSTNQNTGGELKDFDSTAAKSFVQGSDQKTNQSSFELRWNSKPEDEIQWVAGFYTYLDYGDRSDIFRTGPDSVFNQKGSLATAIVDGGLFDNV